MVKEEEDEEQEEEEEEEEAGCIFWDLIAGVVELRAGVRLG